MYSKIRVKKIELLIQISNITNLAFEVIGQNLGIIFKRPLNGNKRIGDSDRTCIHRLVFCLKCNKLVKYLKLDFLLGLS